MRRPGRTTNRPTKRTSPRPAMKHSATLSEARARASWPLPEPTLAYFPNARFVPSDRDPGARVSALRPDRGARVPALRTDSSLRAASAISSALAADGCRQTGGGVAVADNSGSGDFGHVPVLLQRCVELLTPALTRRHSDGSGAVLVDATLGPGG